MGERYLKREETVIAVHYPTSTREEIMALIPNRTWTQIGIHARQMGIFRTSQAWGNSIREGRNILRNSWSVKDNFLFDRLYPFATYEELLLHFPDRTLTALQSHAHVRHLHRTREAAGREMNIGRRNAREATVKESLTVEKEEK